MSTGPGPDYAHYAATLADALVGALPGWVERSVARAYRASRGEDPPAEVKAAAADAGGRAVEAFGPEIRDLLARDIDDQPTTPLALARRAVSYPAAVLTAAGVAPVKRDEFAKRAFPSDAYGLSPATFADIDPDLGDVGIAWGAAKAFEHKQRHRT